MHKNNLTNLETLTTSIYRTRIPSIHVPLYREKTANVPTSTIFYIVHIKSISHGLKLEGLDFHTISGVSKLLERESHISSDKNHK